MTQKTMQELEALKDRLERDIRNSRLQDLDGLTRNTPLVRNYEQVKKDIENFNESSGSINEEVVSEEKFVIGSKGHMLQALHNHIHNQREPGQSFMPAAEYDANYHYHHMNSDGTGAHYLVVHRHSFSGQNGKQAHILKSSHDKKGYNTIVHVNRAF